MSEESTRCSLACTGRSSSAGLGARGRCKAPSGVQGCSGLEAFPRCMVGYLQGKTFIEGEGLTTRSLRWLSEAEDSLVDIRDRKPLGKVESSLVDVRDQKPLGKAESSLVDVRDRMTLGKAESSLVDARAVEGYLIGHEARSIIMSYPALWVGEAPTDARSRSSRRSFPLPGGKRHESNMVGRGGPHPAPQGMFLLFAYHAMFSLIVPCCVELFNLRKMKSDDRTGSRSTVPSVIGAFVSMVAIGSTVEKRASVNVGSSLRKHNRRGTSEQLANALGSTTRVPIEKGKEPVETEEALERGYTLCKLDRAGAEKYFVTIMMRLKAIEGEDPLVSRWSAISGSSQVWTKGPLFGEYLRGAMHSVLMK
ncbi:hypothetical protein B296_00012015 [Ensete ventricosum]|uniref:Uncharacterized protein n=1 Tax=Ensete ventricosum TaxID=4639 RepID=A0A426XT23_ENSVE|nr:hypothetical protein B296_00012015 [Ensete ventricosum]